MHFVVDCRGQNLHIMIRVMQQQVKAVVEWVRADHTGVDGEEADPLVDHLERK